MEPDFWTDSNKASKLLRENSALEKEIKSWEDLENIKEDTKIIIEFADSQEISLTEAENELIKYRNKINEIEVKLTLSNNHDKQSAIMTIHPGAGGTESQDWAEMLYRMYDRWIEKKILKNQFLIFNLETKLA